MPDPIPIAEAVDEYLLVCELEQKSPRTVQAYAETLRLFQRLGAPLDPDRLRPDHVIAYLARFTAHRPDTRHRYFREVRCFWNWLRTPGYTENDPFRGLRNVRLPRTIVPPLGPAEIARLLACCDAATVVGRRDRAILLTLLDTGIRCAEAVQLDLADCALTERRLLVRQGKGGKDRVVPFAGRCDDALVVYLADRGSAASTTASASGRTGSNSCCDASAGPRASRASMPIASATPSPPGPSPTTRGRSTSSICSATAPRRWCAATARPTAAPRPPSVTPPSPPATACSSVRADQTASPSPRHPLPASSRHGPCSAGSGGDVRGQEHVKRH